MPRDVSFDAPTICMFAERMQPVDAGYLLNFPQMLTAGNEVAALNALQDGVFRVVLQDRPTCGDPAFPHELLVDAQPPAARAGPADAATGEKVVQIELLALLRGQRGDRQHLHGAPAVDRLLGRAVGVAGRHQLGVADVERFVDQPDLPVRRLVGGPCGFVVGGVPDLGQQHLGS